MLEEGYRLATVADGGDGKKDSVWEPAVSVRAERVDVVGNAAD